MTEIDELENENERLQQQLDAQRSDQIAAQNALIENRDLRALVDLEVARCLRSCDGQHHRFVAQQLRPARRDRPRVTRRIRVGMPVLNSAGLVGKITNVFPETAIVMLVTDPQYHVPVKVVAQVAATPTDHRAGHGTERAGRR